MEVKRVTSQDKDFVRLIQRLDTDLAKRDGEDHAFYNQFNKIDALKHVVVLYEHDVPVACGAIKPLDKMSMEIKRMYTLPEKRGCGLASKVLEELENWTRGLNYKNCVLETGIRQPEAIALYKKNGYELIPNYGQYAGIENSRCFRKNVVIE